MANSAWHRHKIAQRTVQITLHVSFADGLEVQYQTGGVRWHETRSRVGDSTEVLHQRELWVQPTSSSPRRSKERPSPRDEQSTSMRDATTFPPTRPGVRAETKSQAERFATAGGYADAVAGARTTADVD